MLLGALLCCPGFKTGGGLRAVCVRGFALAFGEFFAVSAGALPRCPKVNLLVGLATALLAHPLSSLPSSPLADGVRHAGAPAPARPARRQPGQAGDAGQDQGHGIQEPQAAPPAAGVV